MGLRMKPSTSIAVTQAAHVQALAHERFVDSFVQQSSRSQLALLLVTGLVVYLWRQSTQSQWPWAWLAAAYAFSLWRFLSTARLVRGSDPLRSTRRIVWMLIGSGALQALPLLSFNHLSDAGRGALTLILVTLATVSVVTTSGFRSVFMAFATPMLLPLAAAWFVQGWLTGQVGIAGLGAMILLFLGFLYAIGRHASAVFMDGCAYRFGEQQLNQELKVALAEADEANRAKTQFLAAASHDLRQPIHSMNVLVAALSLRPLDAPTQEIVGLLGSVNQILSKQLDTLLDISKLDAGVIRADFATCRLDTLVRAHHAVIAPLAAQRGLRMDTQADDATWVHTDAALLTRALSNLTDNALKYTPSGGTVRLIVQRQGGEVLLRIADNGIGIPSDEQERVFREFYQVANVERDRSKGLGLGLSIVRRLCKLLDVTVALDSTPDRGTTVTLTLPLAQPISEAGIGSPAPARPCGLRVLVIDDESMVRDSMRLLLQGLHCEVFLADGALEACEVAAAQTLDLVLSDLRLRGGESGLTVIEAVRALQRNLAAVLITGDTAPERIREAEAAGVPLLFKPVTLDDLIDVMYRRQAVGPSNTAPGVLGSR